MELCDGGELSSLLQEHGPFTEDETRVVVEQLARAISYLHRNGTLSPSLCLSLRLSMCLFVFVSLHFLYDYELLINLL